MAFRAFVTASTSAALFLASVPAFAAPTLPRPLENEIEAAAITCYIASIAIPVRAGRELNEREALDSAWYLFDAVRQKAKPASHYDEMTGMAKVAPSEAVMEIADNAAAYLAACQERWPASRPNRTILLPADKWEKAVACSAVALYLQGVIQGMQQTGSKILASSRASCR